MMHFFETLQTWHDFYFMIGGAAATLIGLIFVAISLGANLVSLETQNDIDTFVTPILIYFISVLVMACVMLIPAFSALFLTILLLLIGAFGLGRMIIVIGQMFRTSQRMSVGWSHWFWHATLPLLSYGLIFGTAMWSAVYESSAALMGPAIATALLLISGIWRAWELVLWIAHQRAGQ